MNEEHRQAAQEYQESLAALNAESEKYITNLSDKTMGIPESFQKAVRREREAYQKLQDLTDLD
ncbi:MAG TPA: hypothetical protein VIH90_04615 [Candidatus Saccharimonadales bacterium]